MVTQLLTIPFAIIFSNPCAASELEVPRTGLPPEQMAAEAERENRIREIPRVYGFSTGESSKEFKLFHTRSNQWTLDQIREKSVRHRTHYQARQFRSMSGLAHDQLSVLPVLETSAPQSELDDMSALDEPPHGLSHRKVRRSILEKIERRERDLAAQFELPVPLLRMCIPYLFEPVRLLEDLEDGIFDEGSIALPLSDDLAKAFFTQLGSLIPKRGYEAAEAWFEMTRSSAFAGLLKGDNNFKTEVMDFFNISTPEDHSKKLVAMGLRPGANASFAFEFKDRPWLIDRPFGFGDRRPYLLNRWATGEIIGEFEAALGKVNRMILALGHVGDSALKQGLLALTLETGRMLLKEAMNFSSNLKALSRGLELGQQRVTTPEEQEALTRLLGRAKQKIDFDLWAGFIGEMLNKVKFKPLVRGLVETEGCQSALEKSGSHF